MDAGRGLERGGALVDDLKGRSTAPHLQPLESGGWFPPTELGSPALGTLETAASLPACDIPLIWRGNRTVPALLYGTKLKKACQWQARCT